MNKNKILNIKDKYKFKYFPNIPGIDRSKLQLTTEGVYSISYNSGSSKLVYLISIF